MISRYSALLPALAIVLSLAGPGITHAAPTFIDPEQSSVTLRTGASNAYSFDVSFGRTGTASWYIVQNTSPALVSLRVLTDGSNGAYSLANLRLEATEEGTGIVRIGVNHEGVQHIHEWTVQAYHPYVRISPEVLTRGQVGTAYQQQMSITGSTSLQTTQTWTVLSGTLPPGTTLNTTTGLLTGTPTQAGTFEFTLQAREVGGWERQSYQAAYAVLIDPPAVPPSAFVPRVSISTRANPVNGIRGQSYSAQIYRATGGTGSFLWSIESGTLPRGMMLGTDGILQGTPEQAGTFALMIQARDATRVGAGMSDSLAIQLVVLEPAAPVPAPVPTTPTPAPLPTPVPTTPTTPSTPAPTPSPTGPQTLEEKEALEAQAAAQAALNAQSSAPASSSVAQNLLSDAIAFGVTLSDTDRQRLGRFIEDGSDVATRALGSGERRALIRDAFDTMGRAPTSVDMERLANGQIPLTRNLAREQAQLPQARAAFRAIYGRDPNFQNQEENLAWNTLMYRIRFPRNLSLEQRGITEYRRIFRRTPSTPFHWATVRLLGYVRGNG